MRTTLRGIALFAVSISAGAAAEPYPTIHGWLRPELLRIDQESTRLRQEQARLPPLLVGNSGIRRGYHGSQTPAPEKPFWLVIDLGALHAIDAVALVPAEGNQGSSSVPGYGFPRTFRIDLSNDPEFNDFTSTADETKAPFPNPGHYPYFAAAGGRQARYVRMYAAQRWPLNDRIWLIALSEIFVLSAGRNVAANATVLPRRGRSVRRPPVWMAQNLVDNQTDLGLPVSHEPSRTHGYQSRPATSEDAVKWVQVDLAQPRTIDEVRLVPAHPAEVPSPGYGFPVRFRVEAADERDFRRPSILADYTREDFLNPGDNLMSIVVPEFRARYVRVTATRLPEDGTREARNIFALAELQVYSKRENVALGAAVQALDALDGPRPPHIAGFYPDGPMWDPKYLVDGYTSRHRLIGLEEWLSGLARRGGLSRRLSELQARRSVAGQEAAALTFWLGTVLTVLLGGGLIGATVYYRHKRKTQLRDLRRSLARDLHDDIGSSLGGIRLTSQLAQSVDGTPEPVLRDLREIGQIAGETGDSMRDIVWLLDAESSTAGELIAQMRLIAGRMLADRDFRLEVHPPTVRRRLPLELRRNILFAFKEAIYNAVRHSGAGRIEIVIDAEVPSFGFRVRDDGCGFDPARPRNGHGLANLHKRAAILQGWVRIESAAGQGASVEFRVPVI